MARTDYYDTDAKLIKTFGSGTPVVRRIIPRADYTKIVNDYTPREQSAIRTFKEQTATKPGHPPPIDYSLKANEIFGGGLEPLLIAGSTVLNIQANGATVIAGLVQAAKQTNKEQGAYIAFQFSTSQLLYVPATPLASSDVEFTFSVARFHDLRFVPGKMTMQIIGTVHTHYADVSARNHDVSGGRVVYSIHPGVSEKDTTSARTEKIVVYAVDANHVHKALPNGQAQDNLPRQLDIITDALETYGRA
jgi:hypothetical protein